MYKRNDEFATKLNAGSQAEERDDIQAEQRDGDAHERVDSEETLPSHITIVPFSTTKTGSFQ